MPEDIFEELDIPRKEKKEQENSLEICTRILKDVQQYKTEERKLEYLEKMLVKNPDQATRRAIFVLMASLQAQRKWFNTAARSYSNAADLASTFREKIDLLLRSMLLFVKAQDYLEAEAVMRKALVLASEKEKPEVHKTLLNAYLQQAQEFESSRALTKTISVLTRALTLKIDKELEKEIKLKLANLYDRIGKPIEANKIRSEIR
ncbi:MAG: hypothetical protein QXP53_01955 [Candidatus Pacearchaeota archaeon]